MNEHKDYQPKVNSVYKKVNTYKTTALSNACLHSTGPWQSCGEPGFQKSLTLFFVPMLFVPKIVC